MDQYEIPGIAYGQNTISLPIWTPSLTGRGCTHVNNPYYICKECIDPYPMNKLPFATLVDKDNEDDQITITTSYVCTEKTLDASPSTPPSQQQANSTSHHLQCQHQAPFTHALSEQHPHAALLTLATPSH